VRPRLATADTYVANGLARIAGIDPRTGLEIGVLLENKGLASTGSLINRESYPGGFEVILNGRIIQVLPQNPPTPP